MINISRIPLPINSKCLTSKGVACSSLTFVCYLPTRLKYADLSFSRSHSDNTADYLSVTYHTDTQNASLPEHTFIDSNSSQPGWRSNYHGDYKDKNLEPICTEDLLSWAFQVSRGMEYLSQRKVSFSSFLFQLFLSAHKSLLDFTYNYKFIHSHD